MPSVPVLVENWRKTHVRQLLEDPAMEAFTTDLKRQLDEKWTKNHDRLGLSWDDVRGIAAGEVAAGLVAATAGQAAVAVLVDVGANEEKTRALLDKVRATLAQRNAVRTEEKYGSSTLVIYQIPPKGRRLDTIQAVYAWHDGLLIASDQVEVAKDILDRRKNMGADHLASVSAYQVMRARCNLGANGLAPHLVWWANPLGCGQALRAAGILRRKTDSTDYLKLFKNQGFEALRGIGGFVNLAEGEYGVLHRTAVHAPQPYEKSMQMLNFPVGGDLTPPAWVSREVAAYTTFRWDLKNAFEKFAPMFDEIYGEEGTYRDTLESIKHDDISPLDIENELIAHLGTRVTVLTDYELPITTTSERRLIAIEAINPAQLETSIRKAIQNDKKFTERQIEGHTIWEYRDIEAEDDLDLEIDHPDDGVAADEEDENEGDTEGEVAGEAEGAADDELAQDGGAQEPVLPNAAVAVVHGHLLIASNVSILEKVLKPVKTEDELGNNADYKLVHARLHALGAKDLVAESFGRLDSQFQATYELFRQGKLPEADTLFAQILNAIMGDDKEGIIRKPKLDGSKLPDFQVVQRYLGPTGSFVSGEENGWFIVGFTLGKVPPLAADNAAAASDTISR